MMSKKHYEAIALLLNARHALHSRNAREASNAATAMYELGQKHGVSGVAVDLATYFASENPRFQRNRFLMRALDHVPSGLRPSAEEQREREEASTAFGATLKSALKRR